MKTNKQCSFFSEKGEIVLKKYNILNQSDVVHNVVTNRRCLVNEYSVKKEYTKNVVKMINKTTNKGVLKCPGNAIFR